MYAGCTVLSTDWLNVFSELCDRTDLSDGRRQGGYGLWGGGLLSNRQTSEGEDSDVIILAEGLGRLRNGFRGLSGDGRCALESKEFPGCGARLYHAVGEQRDLLVFFLVKRGLGVRGLGDEA